MVSANTSVFAPVDAALVTVALTATSSGGGALGRVTVLCVTATALGLPAAASLDATGGLAADLRVVVGRAVGAGILGAGR